MVFIDKISDSKRNYMIAPRVSVCLSVWLMVQLEAGTILLANVHMKYWWHLIDFCICYL